MRGEPVSGAAHTPGPWGLHRNHPDPEAADTLVFVDVAARTEYDGLNIACVFCAPVGSEQEANARLMAASPALLAKVREFAAACAECEGSGLVTIKTWPGGIEVDNDDQPCPDCQDIRDVIALAVKP